MIVFHGTPLSGSTAIVARILLSRFALLSLARLDQLNLVVDHCAGFCVDNGAYTFWRKGTTPSWEAYKDFIKEVELFPNYQFCFIPDVVMGTVQENDKLLEQYSDLKRGVPVFHQGEPLQRLLWLTENFERVAISSVEKKLPSPEFHAWMQGIMQVITTPEGLPLCQIHGLRMAHPEIVERYPFSSVDSTNLGQNYNNPARWKTGRYQPTGPETRGLVLRDRIESIQSPIYYKAENG